ncbi:MAG: type II toxin-antitoxin system mRNA interferase toxin, RelE/StbE family [Patescibacteria group bacterium]
MTFSLHKNFIKDFSRVNRKQQMAFLERRDLFLQKPFHPMLANHKLTGKYEGYRSFNVTGDIRVIFRQTSPEAVLFARIGTHNQLYE